MEQDDVYGMWDDYKKSISDYISNFLIKQQGLAPYSTQGNTATATQAASACGSTSQLQGVSSLFPNPINPIVYPNTIYTTYTTGTEMKTISSFPYSEQSQILKLVGESLGSLWAPSTFFVEGYRYFFVHGKTQTGGFHLLSLNFSDMCCVRLLSVDEDYNSLKSYEPYNINKLRELSEDDNLKMLEKKFFNQKDLLKYFYSREYTEDAGIWKIAESL